MRYTARGYVYPMRRATKAAVAVDTIVLDAVTGEDTTTIAVDGDAKAG